MNKTNIYLKDVDINLHLSNGNNFIINLTPIQFKIIQKILGIKITSNNSIDCFADDTLIQFLNLTINPLKLQPIDE